MPLSQFAHGGDEVRSKQCGVGVWREATYFGRRLNNRAMTPVRVLPVRGE